MYLKVQQLMLDDAAFIGLIQPKVQIVASAKLKDVIYNPVLPRLLLHVAVAQVQHHVSQGRTGHWVGEGIAFAHPLYSKDTSCSYRDKRAP